LNYATSTFELELILMFIIVLIDSIKIKAGSTGNKSESSSVMLWFVILCIPAVLLHLYFML
jgi:hypothetical protein